MVWVKVRWIDPFFAALTAIAPNRDVRSDGTIGDTAHQGKPSGHNPDDTTGSEPERTDADSVPEVRAADASSTLRSAVTMQDVVDAIIASSDRDRLIYIIFNGFIYRAANGWRREVYTGSDKHRDHVHLSGNPNADNDGRPWSSILALGGDMLTPGEYAVLAATHDRVNAVTQMLPTVEGASAAKGETNKLAAAITAIRAEQVAQRAALEAIIASGGNADTAAILAAIERAGQEARDAVADGLEGGAAQVRADS